MGPGVVDGVAGGLFGEEDYVGGGEGFVEDFDLGFWGLERWGLVEGGRRERGRRGEKKRRGGERERMVPTWLEVIVLIMVGLYRWA